MDVPGETVDQRGQRVLRLRRGQKVKIVEEQEDGLFNAGQAVDDRRQQHFGRNECAGGHERLNCSIEQPFAAIERFHDVSQQFSGIPVGRVQRQPANVFPAPAQGQIPLHKQRALAVSGRCLDDGDACVGYCGQQVGEAGARDDAARRKRRRDFGLDQNFAIVCSTGAPWHRVILPEA